jgi:hypothetical protein
VIFIVISILAGITVYFTRPTPLYLKLFPPFLFLTLISEVLSNWMSIHLGNNTAEYNIYLIFSFSFYLNFFREIVNSRLVKKIILGVMCAFFLLSIINIAYIQKIGDFNSITYSLGCLLIITMAFYYFFEIFQHPKATKLTREPMFWITSGLLFYFSCCFPFIGVNNIIKNMPAVLVQNLMSILDILSALLYILFTIAFMCRIKFGRKKAL